MCVLLTFSFFSIEVLFIVNASFKTYLFIKSFPPPVPQ